MRVFVFFTAALLAACSGKDPEECAEADRITVFADNDKDGFGAPDTAKDVCPPVDEEGAPSGEVPRGFSANDDDCDDYRSEVNPGGIELCDGFDNDCDSESDEGLRTVLFFLDGDGDQFGDPDLGNSVTSCGVPAGYVDNSNDCDDGNAAINPDAVEICDNDVDNDCDQKADDDDFDLDETTAPTWYLDGDGDSYGGDEQFQVQCVTPGSQWVANAEDCNDADVSVSPSETEVCNHIDDDCDALIDDSDSDIDPNSQTAWNEDVDNDGLGNPDQTTLACFQPWFHVSNGDDCDDNEPLLGFPAPWLHDDDGDGFGSGAQSEPLCERPGPDWELLAKGRDCDDDDIFVNPLGNEVCDDPVGIDNDCDGLIDDEDDSLDPDFSTTFYRDADNDNFGNPNISVTQCDRPPGYANDDLDCDDQAAGVNPDADEVCDSIDNDCDTLVDDDDVGDVLLGTGGTFWSDFDGDGFGNPDLSQDACTAPDDYVDNDLDCDDTDPDQLVDGPWLIDTDGDGVGAGTAEPASCEAPNEPGVWVPSYFGVDCDNADPTRWPGNIEICGNSNDEDCDGNDPPCFAPPDLRAPVRDALPIEQSTPELELEQPRWQ